MKTPSEIANNGLLLSRGGSKNITSYRHVWRIVKSGRLKSKRTSTGRFLISDTDIKKYNQNIIEHKMLDI
jgi:predicted site-specific integrase-resolvase